MKQRRPYTAPTTEALSISQTLLQYGSVFIETETTTEGVYNTGQTTPENALTRSLIDGFVP